MKPTTQKTLLLYLLLLGTVSSVIPLTACSSDDEEEQKIEAVDIIYNRARDSLAEKNYKAAVKDFEEVERQHPYSEWAVRSQIMAAYSSYKNDDYADAIAILDRFVKQHPGHSSVAYAYYLIAMCYYQQISDISRDQKMTEDALQALDEVIKRFPDSEFARDARLKRDLTLDHLAGKEMEIGRYYQKQQEYLAAINRFKFVIDNYQTTTHTPEALHRLTECYLALGVDAEAKRYASVLGHNYPSSRWYHDSYALLEKNVPDLTPPKPVVAAAPPDTAPAALPDLTNPAALPPSTMSQGIAAPVEGVEQAKEPDNKTAEEMIKEHDYKNAPPKQESPAKKEEDQPKDVAPSMTSKTITEAMPAEEQPENPIPKEKQGFWQKMKSWF